MSGGIILMFGEMYLQGCLEYPGGKLYGGKGIGGL